MRNIPNAGRSSRSVAATPSSAGMQSVRSDRVHEEDQLAARSQDPGRLGEPAIGVGPQAGAVLRDREVEGGVAARHELRRRRGSAGTRGRAGAGVAARSRAGPSTRRCRRRAPRDGRATPTRTPCRIQARWRPCRRVRGQNAEQLRLGRRFQTPQAGSSRAQASLAGRDIILGLQSQRARLRRTCSRGSRSLPRPAPYGSAQESSNQARAAPRCASRLAWSPGSA